MNLLENFKDILKNKCNKCWSFRLYHFCHACLYEGNNININSINDKCKRIKNISKDT
jgi:hypothetical protein